MSDLRERIRAAIDEDALNTPNIWWKHKRTADVARDLFPLVLAELDAEEREKVAVHKQISQLEEQRNDLRAELAVMTDERDAAYRRGIEAVIGGPHETDD